MANVLLNILAGNIADPCFPPTVQELLVLFANNMQAVLQNGLAFYNYGAAKPAPELQGYPWLRTLDGRWYAYSGDWISPHPLPVDGIARVFVTGPAATIAAGIAVYDGGDSSGMLSDRTGPMWVIDTAFDGRMAIGSGTIPGRTIAPTALLSAQTIGAGEHTQIAAEVASHTHDVKLNQRVDLCDGCGSSAFHSGTGTATNVAAAAQPNIVSPAVTVPMDTMPPAVAGYWLKRSSSRVYYKVP